MPKRNLTMPDKKSNILSTIEYPADLRKVDLFDLPQVCKELRQLIIDEVAANPGHFGASLGVVELTVALHYVFNTPLDRIVWDVGHQAYGHKLLTGRKKLFYTNRKYKGISGFPKPSESEYDAFGAGHASTSISAALGMATSFSLDKDPRQVIAVIGDGSIIGGMATEALNHGGMLGKNILVILNDNNISIDPAVGAFKEYLLDISTSKTYNKLKTDVWNMLGKLKKFGPNTQSLIQKIDTGVKSILLKQSNFFEAINFRYFGPVDGHDVVHLVKVLQDLKDIPGPKLLHCQTVKGKGFRQAEIDQTVWHAPGPFNKETGEIIKANVPCNKTVRYQDVFGRTLLELAEKNPNIVGVTPAMPTGCSMNLMMEKMPHRAFDVGIAEQHAVTFSAGMAIEGKIPYCNIYSSFMQRAIDQVIHDVALQNLQVVFCLDRGGLVGQDGATHHGFFDLVYMRMIPNMIVSAPMDEIELRNLLYTAQLKKHGPFVIRYPRGNGVHHEWKLPFKEIEIGKGRKLLDGSEIAILTIGTTGNFVTGLYEKFKTQGFSVAHYDMRFVKPLDEKMLHEVFGKFGQIITVEDGVVKGGFGSAILEFMASNNYAAQVKILGIPDVFIEHGSQQELYEECAFDSASIYKEVEKMMVNRMQSVKAR